MPQKDEESRAPICLDTHTHTTKLTALSSTHSQSALEYMLTYGWAILIIVIVAAALWSFGVFNPSASTSSTSITGFSGLVVTMAEANSNLFAIYMTNTVGYTVNVTGMNITFNGKTYSTFQCGSGNAAFFTLAPQASTTCEIAGSFPSSLSASVSIGYTVLNGLTPYTISQGLIRTPALPSNLIAPIPGTLAYITNAGPNTVSVINLATNTVISTFSVGNGPLGLALGPNGKYVYVANRLSNSLSVINTSNNLVYTSVSVPTAGGGQGPYNVAFLPSGIYAYVSVYAAGKISVVNTTSNSVKLNVTVGNSPIGVAVTPNGKSVYVTNYGSNTVSVINTTSNSVIATVTVRSGPSYAPAITPDGRYVYVPNFGNNTVSVINTATNSVSTTINVMVQPLAVAIAPNGKYAYVTNQGSNTVTVINTTSNKPSIANISVGTTPQYVAITPDGKYAYVTNYGSNSVSVIGTSSNTVVATISVGPAGTDPGGIAI